MTEVRVLQVMGRSTGGIVRHVGLLAQSLDGREGLRVDIAGPGDLPDGLLGPVFPVDIPEGLRGHRRAVQALRELIVENSYQVVHGHGLRASIDSALAARGTMARRIATVHNLVRPEIAGARARFYRRAEPLLVRLNERVFAPSEQIASHLREAAPAHSDRVEVLLLATGEIPVPQRGSDEVRKSLGLDRNTPIVASVTRLAPQKDVPTLLRAIASSANRPHLLVIGTGPEADELKRLASELGIEDRVHWLGWQRNIAEFVVAADVFCLSSVWEARALAAQEAIRLGTPVVCTDVGGMGELIQDGVSGRLVPAGDVGALAEALDASLSDPEEARWMADTARDHLRAVASTEGMLQRVADVYLGRA